MKVMCGRNATEKKDGGLVLRSGRPIKLNTVYPNTGDRIVLSYPVAVMYEYYSVRVSSRCPIIPQPRHVSPINVPPTSLTFGGVISWQSGDRPPRLDLHILHIGR